MNNITIQETIDTLQEYIDYLEDRLTYEIDPLFDRENAYKDTEAFKLAIKALERDTPRKVNIQKWIHTKCPRDCGHIFSVHHSDGYYSIENMPPYCPRCGQKLNWES